jgi:hypothetical protein
MLVVKKRFFSFSPAGRRRGPRGNAWEDEGEQVIQLQALILLTLPLPWQWAPPSPRWGEGKLAQRTVRL